jgi:hypothetical protein
MLNSFKKRRIFVVLLHRGGLSLGDNRKRLGSEAYHWGIFIAANAFCTSSKTEGIYLDVTNGIQPNPNDFNDLNPDGDWHFRDQKMTPKQEARMLCMILIGNIPGTVPGEHITEGLRKLSLPNKDIKDQHCVWWTLNAVEYLQSLSWVASFDIRDLEADGTIFADLSLQMLQDGRSTKVPLLKEYSKCSK